MIFHISFRTSLNQYRYCCWPSVRSKRWFSKSSDAEIRKSSVTVGGKIIKYICRGEGEHVILCIPGALGSSLTDFKQQIEGLDQRAFTVVAWDPPGYGHSRPPNRYIRRGFLKRDADYAVDFMRAIDLPKFSVLGWGDGGITGIFLAARYPENLRKLTIWGSTAYITDEEAEKYKKIRDVSTWSEGMKAPMVELYGEGGFRRMWEQRIDEFLRIHKEDGGDICKAELGSIWCPLFVLHGGKDHLVSPEHPHYMIENVSVSQLHVFEDGGHDIHLQYAKEFNSLVHKFLTSVQSSGGAKHVARAEDVSKPRGDSKGNLLALELINLLKEDSPVKMLPITEIKQVETHTCDSTLKYDVTGLPIPSTKTSKDILREIRATSSYHMLLSKFPRILYPSEEHREIHHHTRHEIKMRISPVASPRPFPLDAEETAVAREIIDSMIRQGTARPSNSTQKSVLRLVRDEVVGVPGWHALGDYRFLNQKTLSETMTTPYPYEISDSVRDCCVFSVVNLRKDWTRIPMAPEDIPKTAVVTTFGTFEFLFMPRGLLNSTRTWQKVLDEALGGLAFCFGYLESILVFSRNHEEHLQHIRTLFQRLSTNGIFVNASSSVFGEPCVDFFNYLISRSGCSPNPEQLVKAIKNMPLPKSHADLGRVIRMNRQYLRFIPVSARGPLRGIFKGHQIDYSEHVVLDWETPVPWTPKLEEAYEDCKSALAQSTLECRPDPCAVLSITVSVNNSAIGAALTQETKDCPAPLAFFSKIEPRNGSSAFYAYLSAIYESIKAFYPLVAGRHFTVYIDHKSSLEVLNFVRFVKPSKFYMASYCSQYTMDVQYVTPRYNACARCLAALLDHCEPSTRSVVPDTDIINYGDDIEQSPGLFKG